MESMRVALAQWAGYLVAGLGGVGGRELVSELCWPGSTGARSRFCSLSPT